MRNLIFWSFTGVFFALAACNESNSKTDNQAEQRKKDSLERIREAEEKEKARPRTAEDIALDKALTYDEHTLEESYAYEDTTREFQLDKIKERLAYVENFQRENIRYAVLQNRRNKNRAAPVVENFVRNDYKRVSDTLGTERYQSAPLYQSEDSELPSIYGRDGWLVRLASSDTLDMVEIKGISFDGTWFVPKRYIQTIGDTMDIRFISMVDVTNQNICTVEKTGQYEWKIRSMNPATSGQHKPPHAMETPTGLFVVQEQKPKMYYYGDGTTNIEGFAPYASRFTNGAYIHGVPVNNPKGKIVEYSWSLGTIPRSHMCVRNASSHAKFVYEQSKPMQSLVIVLD
ncbi:MAG: L,D-transpeptidase [Sphingobacteriaceae bacterium]